MRLKTVLHDKNRRDTGESQSTWDAPRTQDDRQHARPQRVLRQAVDEHILACRHNGYLLGRAGCPHR
eukprot:COSAG01_NODE_2866_length_6949_cov_4.994599_9_plen_67_part_00